MSDDRSPFGHWCRHLLTAGLLLPLLGEACKPTEEPTEEFQELRALHGQWCKDGVGTSMHRECEDDVKLPLGTRRELSRRVTLQWSRLIDTHPFIERPRPRLPAPLPQRRFRALSTQFIVDELAKLHATDGGRDQELIQACDAPEPIRQRIGGVAILLDRGRFQTPAEADVVELPSRPILREEDDVCPSVTAGDPRELDSFNGGTLSILDRHHLVGAGHVLLETVCKPGARLDAYLLAFGVTNESITDHGTIEVPRDWFIDGSTVTVVECHGSLGKADVEGDWVLLRTDECLHAADPVPVRWDQPVAVAEEVHTLGHPAQLTMKYSWPSEVVLMDPEHPLFRMDLVTDGGHSGAPILDTQGRLVGIHKARRTGNCEIECETEAGSCCRPTRCSTPDCRGEGYATHIDRVEDAWRRSRETISWKGCESQ